jgi:hypothetical protein
MIGSPGRCCISSNTGMEAVVPRIRSHCVIPPISTASRLSMFMLFPASWGEAAL